MNKSKPNRSGVIRKGTMPLEEITKLAQELQPEVVKVVEAPKPEPVVKGDYKAFAMSIKSRFQTNNDTVEFTGDFIKSLFPQVRRAGEVVKNLKRTYGLSYRRVEKGRNDTYVFFVEPTREQLIVQLTSAESKVIDQQHHIDVQREVVHDLMEENTKLKSDLFNEKIKTTISLLFAIICLIITIGSQLTSQ